MFSLLIGSSPPFRPISAASPAFLPVSALLLLAQRGLHGSGPRPCHVFLSHAWVRPFRPRSSAQRRVAAACRQRRPSSARWPLSRTRSPVFKPTVAPPPSPFALSLSRFEEKPERLLPLATASRSPAGDIRRRRSTDARNKEHTAPPRSPTPRAHDDFAS
jgi:hypothetical protein